MYATGFDNYLARTESIERIKDQARRIREARAREARRIIASQTYDPSLSTESIYVPPSPNREAREARIARSLIKREARRINKIRIRHAVNREARIAQSQTCKYTYILRNGTRLYSWIDPASQTAELILASITR